MRQVTELEEVQAIGLSILERVDKFCTEAKIQYFLAYGTLIGAVRHKGFIPWDDDIDLWMKRSEYERFIESFPAWAASHELFLNCEATTAGYNRMFAKVCDTRTKLCETQYSNPFREGAFIDVFPVDGLPTGKVASWTHLNRLQYFKLSLLCSAKKKEGNEWRGPLGAFKKGLAGIVGAGSPEAKTRGYRETALRCMPSESDFVCFPITGRMGRNIVGEASDFSSAITVEFEGRAFPAPVGYDRLLKAIFGDYMSLPPESQRVPHHDFVLYADFDDEGVAER